ncbi:hypothetical protein Nhal_2284 [Nitrosococcus halophilus Nc 4]|uniref:Uncharacterized protein n=1 Tax=Nitrosococcus halophilus (strain Nc4) TaxID=472759 RepID=D5BV22_NITHN|nr:hypothetical protein Nhal_2284 [Nitrosococcus halophilus Nc 4]
MKQTILSFWFLCVLRAFVVISSIIRSNSKKESPIKKGDGAEGGDFFKAECVSELQNRIRRRVGLVKYRY